MKSWQGILINGCITVLAVFMAVGLFLPDAPPDKTKEIPEALNAQIKDVRLKLTAIEDAILKQKEQAAITPAPSEPTENPGALAKLGQKLDMILGKLAVLENQGSGAQAPQTFGRSFGSSPMLPGQLPTSLFAKGHNPRSWIDNLPDDKKQEVEIILQENAIRIREKLPPPDPDGTLPDRETVTRIIKENDLLLKQELKAVLNEEEYQQFQDAHPRLRIQFPKRPTTQRNP